MAQTNLPYAVLPDLELDYTEGSIVARTIDGLGFRYYWATEGLTEKELTFTASEDSRDIKTTLEHILQLSKAVRNAVEEKPNIRPETKTEYTLEQLRLQTLNNLKIASDAYKLATASEFKKFNVTFQRGENRVSFPFWNLLNGQLSDAIYHTGQVVLLRRIAGNPINPKVNVFLGKLND